MLPIHLRSTSQGEEKDRKMADSRDGGGCLVGEVRLSIEIS